jgi:hypothetical protein
MLTATPSPLPKTETPAPTITPEGLGIAELTQEKLANIEWADFTPATWDDIAKLNEFILNNPKLIYMNIGAAPMKVYPALTEEGRTYLQGSCSPGVNCIPRFAVSMELPHGTVHLFLIEAIVKNPDGTNSRVMLTIAMEPQKMTQKWNDGMIKNMRRFSTIIPQGFRILLKVNDYSHYSNPVVQDIVDLSSGPFDLNRQQAESGYFNENTWNTILWILSQHDG